jgi:pyoverdine/dityrosine biosynthesis protein Dit1
LLDVSSETVVASRSAYMVSSLRLYERAQRDTDFATDWQIGEDYSFQQMTLLMDRGA